jgi:hypothetical protein
MKTKGEDLQVKLLRSVRNVCRQLLLYDRPIQSLPQFFPLQEELLLLFSRWYLL